MRKMGRWALLCALTISVVQSNTKLYEKIQEEKDWLTEPLPSKTNFTLLLTNVFLDLMDTERVTLNLHYDQLYSNSLNGWNLSHWNHSSLPAAAIIEPNLRACSSGHMDIFPPTLYEVRFDGSSIGRREAVLRFRCNIDISHWPMDMQNCTACIEVETVGIGEDNMFFDLRMNNDTYLKGTPELWFPEKLAILSRDSWTKEGITIRQACISRHYPYETQYLHIFFTVILKRRPEATLTTIELPALFVYSCVVAACLFPEAELDKVLTGSGSFSSLMVVFSTFVMKSNQTSGLGVVIVVILGGSMLIAILLMLDRKRLEARAAKKEEAEAKRKERNDPPTEPGKYDYCLELMYVYAPRAVIGLLACGIPTLGHFGGLAWRTTSPAN